MFFNNKHFTRINILIITGTRKQFYNKILPSIFQKTILLRKVIFFPNQASSLERDLLKFLILKI